MIKPAEYARRRRQMMRTLGEGAIVVVPGAVMKLRNGDVAYPFRQQSDFQYLAGFSEPDAVLVLAPGRERGECVLFCRPRDRKTELWDGPMVGLRGAVRHYGMDEALPIKELDTVMPGLLAGRERLYYPVGQDRHFDHRVLEWADTARQRKNSERPPEEFISLDHHLHDMRLYKSTAEVRSMARSAKIAAQAHVSAIRRCRPGMMEYQLRAELLRVMHEQNAEASYAPIVGGGPNSCVLHYISCQERLNDGDLVLVDAGAEYDHYASDITRTYPVNGKFTDEQRAVYDIVLSAQEAAIAAARPGASWSAPHDAAVREITRGLLRLKLIEGRLNTAIRRRSYEKYFMHKTGHWLGMDVHDVGDYEVHGEARELEVGMALTVEPGLYLGSGRHVPARFRNIGIRIEDSIVIRRDGPQVLSSDVPKQAKEIEALMA